MRYSLFLDVTQRGLASEVLGQTIRRMVSERPLTLGPIGRPRTSVIINQWNGCCFLQTITSRFVSDVFASRTIECGGGPSGFTEERNFLTFEF